MQAVVDAPYVSLYCVPVVTVVEATVCEALTVYVPIPPDPETIPVMVVPAVTVDPDSTWPTAIVPDATAVTVSVVAAIDPVTTLFPAEVKTFNT